MIVFPAIDIKDGNCVRLYKGDFLKSTIFNKSPLKQALKFKQQGFRNIHIVDLDAALGKKSNQKIILEIIKIFLGSNSLSLSLSPLPLCMFVCKR